MYLCQTDTEVVREAARQSLQQCGENGDGTEGQVQFRDIWADGSRGEMGSRVGGLGGTRATPYPILTPYRGRGTVCPSTARGVTGCPAPNLWARQHGQHSILNFPPPASSAPSPHFQGSPGTGREGEGWLQTPLPHRFLSMKI